MNDDDPAQPNRIAVNWPLLSGLRFILASVVLCSHIAAHTEVAPFTWIRELNPFCAVLVFFTISGFSIRHSVTAKPQGFMQRRIWRIWPVYLACFVLSLVPLVLWALYPERLNLPGEMPTPAQLFGNLFMMQNLLVPVFATNAAAWSLAIEEIYYATARLLIKVPPLVLWCLLAGSAALFTHTQGITYSQAVGITVPLALLWSWLLGWQLHSARASKWTQLIVVALPVVLIASHNQSSLGSPGLMLMGCLALIVHQNDFTMPERWQKIATYGGEISYPMYLSHCPVLAFLMLFGALNPWVALVASVAVSIVLYHAVDAPCRRRFRNRSERVPSAVDAKTQMAYFAESVAIKAAT